MKFKIQIEIEGKWEVFDWQTLNETILFGNDLSSYKKRFWTGLHDKNGVEIYEGDILTHKCFVGDLVKNEIVFERGAFKMNPIYEIAILAPQNWRVCEIIGNIHQNPELLK